MASSLNWLTEADGFSLWGLAIDAAIKGTLLLLLAGVCTAMMRHCSAAVRHRTWCLTFGGLLLLPLLSYALPAWRIPVLPPSEPPPIAASTLEGEESSTDETLHEDPTTLAAAGSQHETDEPDMTRFGSDGTPGGWPYAFPPLASGDITDASHVASVGDEAESLPDESADSAAAAGMRLTATAGADAGAAFADLAFWSFPVLALWLIGSALVLLPLIAGLAHGVWLGVRARRLSDPNWTGLLLELSGRLQLTRHVELLELDQPVIPMTWGIVRPVVIVPRMARQWSDRLRRFVLLHELAHVKRWDVPLQLLGRVACGLYWFHPLAWYALRRLRIERELACDDCVVTAGERPSDYAEQLLQIVRTCRPASSGTVAVAMARTNHLEGRIRAMFDRARSHLPLSVRAGRTLSVAAAVLVTTVAVVRPGTRDVAEPPASSSEAATAAPSAVEQAAAGDDNASTTTRDDAAKPHVFTYHGRVEDQNGVPVAGAKLQLGREFYLRETSDEYEPRLLATTGESGEFEFAYKPDEFYGSTGDLLLVTADAFGPACLRIRQPQPTNQVVFRLSPDDVPIEGQILDLEGRPVADAEVKVVRLRAMDNEDLTGFISAVKAGDGSSFRFDVDWREPQSIALQTTDAEGRFRITGMGRERVVELEILGRGIHHATIRVMTRPSEPITVAAGGESSRFQAEHGDVPVFGATFSYLVQPSRAIRGVVVDAETAEPLPRVNVGALQSRSHAVTDDEGRFELPGCAKSEAYRLLASSGDGQPYLLAGIKVPDQPGLEPQDVRIEMTRGIMVSGRVTDQETGKPVSASVDYWPTFPNEHLRPGIGGIQANAVGAFSSARTNRRGEFALPVLPGPGLIGISATAGSDYQTANVDAVAFFRAENVAYGSSMPVTDDLLVVAHSDVSRSAMPQSNFQAIELLNLDPAETDVKREVQLRPAAAVSGRVVDPDGRPIGDVRAQGLTARGSLDRELLPAGTFAVTGLGEKETRFALFRHAERKLAAAVEITAKTEPPLTVRMQPWGEVKGRCLDAEGEPLANVPLHVSASRADGQSPKWFTVLESTDDAGRFHVDGLVPGGVYWLQPQGMRQSEVRVVVQSGEVLDVGDVRPKTRDVAEPPASSAEAATAAPSTVEQAAAGADAPDRVTLRGTVVDPAGRPLAGATVRAQAPIYAMLEPVVPGKPGAPLSEVRSDANGKFEISFTTTPFGNLGQFDRRWTEIWKYTVIAASAPGYGPAWVKYDDLSQPGEPLTLRLVDDLPVQGRIVDLEGRPVAGASVQIGGPSAAGNEDLSPWLAGIMAGEPPWTVYKHTPKSVAPKLVGIPDEVTSDADGRFEIRGVGRERHFSLVFEGETVAHKSVQVATRIMEPVQAVVSPPPFEGKEPVYGARFTFAAASARTVNGTVRDAATSQPLSGVAVESYKLADYPYSNHRVLKTVTDAEGRFRLIGMPKGDGNKLLVLPNDEQPYFMQVFDLPDPPGLDAVDVEIELHRGIWITGRVTDAVSEAPVHARLHYLPYRTNPYAIALPEFDDDGNVDGDQMRYRTKPDGTFRLVGLPGPAVIGAESVLKDYPMGQGYAQIPGPRSEKNNWVPTYNNPVRPSSKWPTAMTYIDPPADAETIKVEFKFEAGSSVSIQLFDPDGQTLHGVEVVGRQPRFGGSQAIDGAAFDAINFGPEEERTLLFRHKSRDLGWVQRIKASDAKPQPVVIKLHPVATLKGRLVTPTGDPITGMAIDAWPLPSGDFARRLEQVATDSQGRFTYTLLPGARYMLRGEGGGVQVVEIAKELAIEPGQSIDLGVVTIDEDGKVMEKPAAAANMPARPLATVSATSAEKVDHTAARDNEHGDSYSGQVVDGSGGPLPDATVWMALHVGEGDAGKLLRNVATSGEDGRFQFMLDPDLKKAIDAAAMHWNSSLVVVATGRGLGWFPLQVFADDPASDAQQGELKARLIKAFGEERIAARSLVLRQAERPVRGRLVDLEGRPRANVTIRVESVRQPDIELLLRAFEEKFKDRYYEAINATGPAWGIDRRPLQQFLPAVTTDADGRFELNGIGNDQLATLSFAGAGVESQVIHVLGRSMEPVRIPHLDSYPSGSKDVFYGWDFNHVVGPSVPVTGVVKEFDSGAPVPNTLVRVERLLGEGGGSDKGQLRLDTSHMRTMTDAQGRFQIDGLPPGKGHVLVAEPPKSEPLLMMRKSISLNATDAAAAEVEIQVKRVFWIEGRVTDKQTGEPVTAYVDYLPLRKNPNTLDKIGLNDAFELHRYHTGNDGRYRVPGLPGPGVVLVCAIADRGYPKSVGAETVDGYDKKRDWLPTTHGYPLSNWNLIRQIEPAMDAASFTCDLELNAGQTVAGTVVRPDRTAVPSFSALGEIAKGPFWKLIADGRFSVKAYDGVGPRQLFFKTSDESLVGKLLLEGPVAQDVFVTLEPAVRVTGRLIAEETNLPADRYSLYCGPSSLGYFRIDDCKTGDDGRFEVKGLMAGVTYEIHTANSQNFSTGKNNFTVDLSQATPGDVIDLGDVRIAPDGKVMPQPSPAVESIQPLATSAVERAAAGDDNASATTRDDAAKPHVFTYHGRVVDQGGAPVAGAQVYVIRSGWKELWEPLHEELARVTPKADGRFDVTFTDPLTTTLQRNPGKQPPTGQHTCLFATAEGYAPAFVDTETSLPAAPVLLKLERASEPVSGRVLDLEGQPIANANVRLWLVFDTAEGAIDDWLKQVSLLGADGRLPRREELVGMSAIALASYFPIRHSIGKGMPGLPSGTTTDAEGRFRFHDFGSDRLAILEIDGPGIVPKRINVVTRHMPAVDAIAMNYPGIREDRYYCASFDYVAEPARPILGTVRDGDTGEPLPGVILKSEYLAGSRLPAKGMLSATTDDDGRFRIDGLPKGHGNRLSITPRDGQPYFVRQVDVPETSGVDPIELTLDMKRGVLITGWLTDLRTGRPVKATLCYTPLLDNPHAEAYENFDPRVLSLLPKHGEHYVTDSDGRFRLVAIPGRGILAARCEDAGFVLGHGYQDLAEWHTGELNRLKAYDYCSADLLHSLQLVAIEAGATEAQYDLQVDSGTAIVVQTVDESGAPISGVKVNGETSSLAFHAGSETPEVTIRGLGDDWARRVIFYQPERQLGHVMTIRGTGRELANERITLRPCGTITGRLVRADGSPVTSAELEVRFPAANEPPLLTSTSLQRLDAVAVESDGTFRYDRIPPHGPYQLIAQSPHFQFKALIEGFTVRPGQTIDLGDVNVDGKLPLATSADDDPATSSPSSE